MPNWVYNKITVSGDERRVTQFRNQARRGTPFDEGLAPEFAFWNFIRPDDSILHEYRGAENLPFSDVSPNSWYEWNTRNWGTKWDACSVSVENGHNFIDIFFETAWAAPMPVFEEIVRQYPDLQFEFFWEEEQGFGEEWHAINGELVKIYEWSESMADTIL